MAMEMGKLRFLEVKMRKNRKLKGINGLNTQLNARKRGFYAFKYPIFSYKSLSLQFHCKPPPIPSYLTSFLV